MLQWGSVDRSVDFILQVFLVEQVFRLFNFLLHAFLGTKCHILVVLHFAKSRENRHSDVTVTLDALDSESRLLGHISFNLSN